MNYVIDGYNLFFLMEEDPDPLDEKREEFVRMLNSALHRLGLSATAVFDGHLHVAADCPTTRQLSALEIVFPPEGLSADAFIVERVKGTNRKEREIIVTSDKTLSAKVRQLGAKTQTAQSFLQLLTHHKKRAHLEEEKMQTESFNHYKRLLRSFEQTLDEESSD